MKLINIEKIKEARERLNGVIAYNKLAFAPRLSKIAMEYGDVLITMALEIKGL
ncbi:hypothetical protein [Brachyspira catarrhinii]|uniref:hypothetical protein n=1 Tax=Brachyspira catarrhinii TaxID=2528966 RepID=UPI001386CFF6|nr:hypothetical protein [Brachyspira catarrhinii]